MAKVSLIHYEKNNTPPTIYQLGVSTALGWEDQFRGLIPDYFNLKEETRLISDYPNRRDCLVNPKNYTAFNQYRSNQQVDEDKKVLVSLLERRISLLMEEERELVKTSLSQHDLSRNSGLKRLYELVTELPSGGLVLLTDNYEAANKLYKCDKYNKPYVNMDKLAGLKKEMSMDEMNKFLSSKYSGRDLDLLLKQDTLVWLPFSEVCNNVPRLMHNSCGVTKISFGEFSPRKRLVNN